MNGTVTQVFAFNTAADGSGTQIGSVEVTSPKWSSTTDVTYTFDCPTTGTYYLNWYDESTTGSERVQACLFSLTEVEVTYPRDIQTLFFKNPDFETGNTSGWTTTTGAQNNQVAKNRVTDATANAENAFGGTYFYENWNQTAFTGKMYQTATLTEGIYHVSLAAFVNTLDEDNATEVSQYVFANDVRLPLNTNINRKYSTYIYVNGDLSIGLEQDKEIANWMGIDSLVVTQYDPEAAASYNAYGESMQTLLATDAFNTEKVKYNSTLKTTADADAEACLNATDVTTAKEKAAELQETLAQIISSKTAYSELKAAIDIANASEYKDYDIVQQALTTANTVYDEAVSDDDAVNETIDALNQALSDAKASAASYNAGDDVTDKFITNPTFYADNARSFNGWTVEQDHDYSWNALGGGQNANLVEGYQNAFNVSQTISGLKAGYYALSIQGFQRPGTPDATLTDFLTGKSATTPTLFAGDNKVMLHSIFDAAETDATTLASGSWSNYLDDAKVPNEMNTALTLMEENASNYKNQVLFKASAGASLSIGIDAPGNKSASYWTIFNDFSLVYVGTEATEVAPYLTSLVDEAKDLATLYASIDAKTSLLTAISEAETAAAGTDADAMLTEYYDLASAMEALRATSTEAANATFSDSLFSGKDNEGDEVGLATFSSPRYAVTFEEGSDATTKAYVATAVNGTTITFERVLAAPANTGLVLMGTKDGQFSMNGVASADALTVTNLLQPGQDEFGKRQSLATENNYVLYNGNFCSFTNAGKMQPNKAYLHAEDAGSAKQLTFVFEDETTGVKTVKTVTVDAGKYYNLNGMEIDKPSQQGVYIHNGKKIMVR